MEKEKQLLIKGMDMLLEKFNRYPDNKTFTVEEIIKASNEVYAKILEQ